MAAADFAGRSEAREEALELLYAADVRGQSITETLAARRVTPLEYAAEITEGLAAHLGDVDAAISRHLTGWRIERMPVLDRAIARIAAYEIAHRPDVPTGVVLAEAVGLAEAYCGERSQRFLNGVLAAVAREARPAADRPADAAAPNDEAAPDEAVPDGAAGDLGSAEPTDGVASAEPASGQERSDG